jgi:uncharacterized membrane protein
MKLQPISTITLSVFIVAAALWLSLFLAWQTLSQVDFLYPQLYELMDIDDTVRKYGPQNRFKQGFGATGDQEHFRLFGLIVDAINDNGKGLRQLQYHNGGGKPIDYLLREPEIVHLRDVATLLDGLRRFSWIALGILVIGMTLAKRKGLRLPTIPRVLLSVTAVIAIVALAIALYGPKDFFYAWHTLVFPADHQWFFYYQDSLMTTMMKAPDLFGYIAVLLVLMMLMFFLLILFGIRWLLKPSARRPVDL